LADDIAEITTGVENLDIEEKGIKTRIVLSLEKKKKYQETRLPVFSPSLPVS